MNTNKLLFSEGCVYGKVNNSQHHEFTIELSLLISVYSCPLVVQ